MTLRIEIRPRNPRAPRAILTGATQLGIDALEDCRVVRLYFLESDIGDPALEILSARLLTDPVTETAHWTRTEHAHADDRRNPRSASGADNRLSVETNGANGHTGPVVEVTLRPGVTDVAARELERGVVELGLPATRVASGTRYELYGALRESQVRRLATQLLSNQTVQHFRLGEITPQFGEEAAAANLVERVALAGLDGDALLQLSKARLLSLDVNEMTAIQEFYAQIGRDPTDVELETLAQTWSEHCVHKTFRAEIQYTRLDAQGQPVEETTVDGLFSQYIRAATEAIGAPWLRSVFTDNAGIVAFDDTHDLAFKVETHNHPSALEPFGGANTGMGGVVRDILGVSARPIATTDVLCFGPQDFPNDQLPEGVLHPARIAAGVVDGIADYGNKLGLPTVNGAVLYDSGYLGNPLVFCGCVGILPHGSHPTTPQPEDLIIVLGGRTGRDGLHGATFSSAELTHDTAETTGSAVQIGDPITEKGLIELVEAARDRELYSAITDCGAGGLSSAVGEMGSELGADVELTRVALKYPGLVPWEIWLSEAQERLVLAVPAIKLAELQTLARLWDVEVSVLGRFTGDGMLRVNYDGTVVAELPMTFVHDGLPRRHMTAVWQTPDDDAAVPPIDQQVAARAISLQSLGNGDPAVQSAPDQRHFGALLLRLLAHPTVASKEAIVRRYDHEVRGGTLVRPFTGPHMDGPTDAAVLKPLNTWRHDKAFALSVGINPLLGRRDPYAMAISAIDEAFRNAVAVGADPDQVAILDNFCWGNPTLPDRLGGLVRACQGCYDGALAYGAPYISGKDSLYNEFNGEPIPGTLLISALAMVPDMHRCVTSAWKAAGNALYVLGETRAEFGGSLLYAVLDAEGGTPPAMPSVPLLRYRAVHEAMRAGLVQSCHDASEGGLAVALAEMALGGRLGATIQLGGRQDSSVEPLTWLFAESNGRLVLEVRPEDVDAFEAHFVGVSLYRIGTVADTSQLTIAQADATLIDLPVRQLTAAWQRRDEPVG
ncbi:MAG: phosphoribosylformylglycinamidine synthase subunit PurL [Litorilinea sp.]